MILDSQGQQQTFKISLELPQTAFENFKALVDTSINALEQQEAMLRGAINDVNTTLPELDKYHNYLATVVIPQRIIAEELKRAYESPAPKIII